MYYHSPSPQADEEEQLQNDMEKLDWFEQPATPGVAA